MEPVTEHRIYSNRYQVTHLIARGGMAMVYRAHDLLLNRFVALKILYPELSVDRNFVERFRREAQAAANLSHPNIVPVFDWGEESGTYFIVMELIEGTSLAELLSDSRTLSPAKSAQVCAQVASALSYAHRQGVVHRDVKPGNILLTTDGQVKVTDFGIAQAISTEDNLTVAGSVMGTATYFSPEQAEGALVDGRSDVYSLGVVLYELLAGRPPFMGDSPIAVASKHVREVAPPPSQFNPTLPADLEAVTMHALAKRPSERYQTADEFRADLMRFSEGQPVSAHGVMVGDDVTRAVGIVAPIGERTQAVPIMSGPRTDIKRRRRRRPWIFVLLALLVIGAAVAAYIVTTQKQTTAMPHVVGLPVNQAISDITGSGLVVGGTKLVVSTTAAGTVTKQRPAGGTKLKKGQKVYLTISKGTQSSPVKIPNVLYQLVGQAQLTLQNDLLNVIPIFTSVGTGNYPPNTVINVSPSVGTTVNTGDTVTLTIVAPDSSYPVPKVANDTQLGAANVLGNAGLSVSGSTTSACSNTVTPGNVVGTNPAAGQPVKSGQLIELILSSGVCDVSVPNVTGYSESEATSALEAPSLKLTPTYNYVSGSSCIVGGTEVYDYVVSTTPAANAQTPYGSNIQVNYCAPASSTTTSTSTTTTTT